METMYQRTKIQEESMRYEHKKQSGELPIVGVNTFLTPGGEGEAEKTELIRSTEEEKNQQIDDCHHVQKLFADEGNLALEKLKRRAQSNDNLFDELMETTKVCTLGQISNALYRVGGAYRRNM